MSNYLTEEVALKWLVGYSTSNTGVVETAYVDMAGFDGCVFICALSTVTGSATVSMQIQGCATASATGTNIADAVAAASGSGDSNTLIVVDVFKPAYRYLSADLTRATDVSVISSVIAVRYHARNLPTTNDSLATAVVESAPAA